MAARKKKAAIDPAQTDLEEVIAEKAQVDFSQVKPAELIAEYHLLKAHTEEQTKKFGDYLKPTNTRIEEIRQLLHGKALHEGVNAFSTDNGTAYLSRIVTHKIDPESTYTNLEGRVSRGRDALLDWGLDFWDDYGSEGLQINVSKDVVQKWMDDKRDDPQWNEKGVPGIKLDTFVRLNIKQS